jgi:simple sugar transport system ATP-binding protein
MQHVTICRVLHRNAQIIILDEPTSILTEQETSSLFKTLKTLAAAGKSLILITHKLQEIKQVCDRVAVLRRGELVGIRNAADIDEYEIAKMMMGGNSIIKEEFNRELVPSVRTLTKTNNKYEIEAKVRRTAGTSVNVVRGKKNSDPVIVFNDVTVLRWGQERPLLDRVSFSIGSGEILGFTGVGGNGLGVLEAVLGGFLHPASGKILHRGKDISRLNIRRLRNQGLAYVPADRLHVGSAVDAAVGENLIINRRREFHRRLFIDKKSAAEFSRKLADSFNIEGAHGAAKASFLSGGNLQKLILAREINWFKDYIVFSEPTWGLDIASSRFITEEIAALREKGAAVILISTNLDEITSLADRIMVMYRGAIAGEFANNGDASLKEAIGNCMQGLV